MGEPATADAAVPTEPQDADIFEGRRAGDAHLDALRKMLDSKGPPPRPKTPVDHLSFDRQHRSPTPDSLFSVIPMQTTQISYAPSPTTQRNLTACYRTFRPNVNYPKALFPRNDPNQGRDEMKWLAEDEVFLPKQTSLSNEELGVMLGDEVDYLNLSGCHWLSKETLEDIGMHCKNLVKLNLEGCSAVDDDVIISISLGCPDLSLLNINGCSAATPLALSAIAKGCTNLDTLHAHRSNTVTDETLGQLTESCSKLHFLDVSYCDQITDVSLHSIAGCCQQLQVLKVSGCTRITDAGISGVAKACRELVVLHLNLCAQPEFTQAGLASIWENLKLEELSLTGCGQFKDADFKKIGDGGERLQKLYLSGVKELTDDTARTISKGCPSVAVLDLSCCANLTDSSLQAFVRNCLFLRTIILNMCPEVTEDSIEYVHETHPSIKVVRHIAKYSDPLPLPKWRAVDVPKKKGKKGKKGKKKKKK